MYRDFTHSAEAMRRERYRVASTATRNVGRSLRTRVGHSLMRMGQRLTDTPVMSTDIEAASV
jgi:hypothetical protein